MKRIGVVLSGCGVYDGSEIHEATLTLYFLDQAGVETVIAAPDRPQREVINHRTGAKMDESRNILTESARIARGKIIPLANLHAQDIDGIILPGGSGAAKNLSSLAIDGANATVDPDLLQLIGQMHAARKPIGAICISPALLARILAHKGITVTVGSDASIANAIASLGNQHQKTNVDQIAIDEKNNIISTAAYMCAASIAQVGEGIAKLVAEVVKRA